MNLYQIQTVTVSQSPFHWKLLLAIVAFASDFVIVVVVDLCFNLNKTSCQCGILFLVLCSLLSERSKDFRTGGGYNGKCSDAIMPIWIGTSEYWYINGEKEEKKKTFPQTHIKFNDTLVHLATQPGNAGSPTSCVDRWIQIDIVLYFETDLSNNICDSTLFARLLALTSRLCYAFFCSLNVLCYFIQCSIVALESRERCNQMSWHPISIYLYWVTRCLHNVRAQE